MCLYTRSYIHVKKELEHRTHKEVLQIARKEQTTQLFKMDETLELTLYKDIYKANKHRYRGLTSLITRKTTNYNYIAPISMIKKKYQLPVKMWSLAGWSINWFNHSGKCLEVYTEVEWNPVVLLLAVYYKKHVYIGTSVF